MTIGHARDWLTLHAGASETAEGLRSFRRKQEIPYPKIRCKAAGPAESFSGHVDTAPCPTCNESMPSTNAFCGACGTKLKG
jgi:hypothetical protein